MNCRCAVVLLGLLGVGACAGPGLAVDALLPADIVLLGEQHDAPAHQRAHLDVVRALAARAALAAVVLEMADQGASTAALPTHAPEAAVQAQLRWNESAWPWRNYAELVMAAVRAGVPVLGSNLPRARMREAMNDGQLDTLLADAARSAQQQAIREGHCDLLPEAQIGPMTRIQIARDRAMAQTLAQAARPGKTVLLIAGGGHVDPLLGVPLHLPPGLTARSLKWPAQPPVKDYCAELRQQLAPRAPV